MKIVLYGATGKTGGRILKALNTRGHQATTPSRQQDDLTNVETIASTIAGADVVVSAYAPPQENTDALLAVTKNQIAAVRKNGKARLIVVGGAGSLEVAPGVSLLQSGHLPKEWIPIATSHGKALELLKASDINWTYFSPAAYFGPGERTGKFRLGTNNLIANEKGESRISMEDYAIALVEEVEKPKHERAQFSIGY